MKLPKNSQQMLPTHEQRVKQELAAAGVTKYGFMKFAVHYLPGLIHDDEHIGGIVYGRYTDKKSGNRWNEGMLVATNLRIIFLDHKPGYTASDEISYSAVSGVKLTWAVFSAVTLHTRVGDYQIRFVNTKCANKFVSYVEDRQLEDTEQLNKA
jgi:hypothetical protein